MADSNQKSRCGVKGCAACGTWALLAFAGCGGNDAVPQQQQQQTQAAQPATTATAAPAQPMAGTPGQSTSVVPQARSSATRWIGGIPYDVFYDRPLEVAANSTSLVSAGTPANNTAPAADPATTQQASSTATPEPMPQPASSGAPAVAHAGETDWESLAPMEVVVEEIGRLRNELQTQLNTLGDYNKNFEAIGIDATELAVLAGIVEIHPGTVSWKPNAKIARDLAAKVNQGATKTGRSAYDATKAPFDSLVDLLSGNPPADATADDGVPFADYAARVPIMYRMQAILEDLKSNVTTAERLTEDPAMVRRKLTVLAALMTVNKTEGYELTDDPEFTAFVDRFVSTTLQARAAAEGKDLDSFTRSLGELRKTCDECHLAFGFN